MNSLMFLSEEWTSETFSARIRLISAMFSTNTTEHNAHTVCTHTLLQTVECDQKPWVCVTSLSLLHQQQIIQIHLLSHTHTHTIRCRGVCVFQLVHVSECVCVCEGVISERSPVSWVHESEFTWLCVCVCVCELSLFEMLCNCQVNCCADDF